MIRTAFFFTLLTILPLANASESDFKIALDLHLKKSLNQQIERLAGKMSISAEEIIQSSKISNDNENYYLVGFPKMRDSSCKVEGKISILEKSIRATCIDPQGNIKIIF